MSGQLVKSWSTVRVATWMTFDNVIQNYVTTARSSDVHSEHFALRTSPGRYTTLLPELCYQRANLSLQLESHRIRI